MAGKEGKDLLVAKTMMAKKAEKDKIEGQEGTKGQGEEGPSLAPPMLASR